MMMAMNALIKAFMDMACPMDPIMKKVKEEFKAKGLRNKEQILDGTTLRPS
jgi:hypothetical protein